MKKIPGIIDRERRRVYVRLPLVFNGKTTFINFIVDTGAYITSLGFLDAEKLTSVNVDELPRSPQPIAGVGGNVDARVLTGKILLLTPEGEILERYGSLITTVPKIRNRRQRVDIHKPEVIAQLAVAYPSLLGMDIISKGTLHISFRNDEAYLEIP